MDNVVQENASPVSIRGVLSRSSRSKTTPSDLESRASSRRSNGQSSIESTPDKSRPKTAGVGQDDAIKAGVSGISRLIPNRRKKKRHETSQRSVESGSGETVFQSPKDIPASGSSVHDNMGAKGQSGESNSLLTDNSEPDQ
jgi:hypothetical protein